MARTLNLSQLVTETRRFSVILVSQDVILHRANVAHGSENLGDSIVLALAQMFELVGEILLL